MDEQTMQDQIWGSQKVENGGPLFPSPPFSTFRHLEISGPPALGFRKQERQLTTGSTGGCLQSIAQRTRSGACSYWIGIPFRLIPKIKLLATVVAAFLQVGRPSYHSTNSVKALKDALYLQHT